MQLALNIIVFFLGFSAAIFVAVRPSKFRDDIDGFLAKLRYVTNGFKPAKGSPSLGDIAKQHVIDSGNESEDEEGAKFLYTR